MTADSATHRPSRKPLAGRVLVSLGAVALFAATNATSVEAVVAGQALSPLQALRAAGTALVIVFLAALLWRRLQSQHHIERTADDR
ncbi:MAG: hypothetical protein FJ363_12535 [Gemmatimonadetes bacterium]|nr:hypothetical protein [Gemmatimonadota bacterium]